MNVKLIALGKLRDKYFSEAFAEYEKRLSAYCKFELVQLNEERFSSDNAPRKEIESALEKEADVILSKIPKGALVISLCVEGKQMTTEEFSALIDNAAVSGRSDICFVIGSSYGLSDRIKQRSDIKLSFSKMTFPHTLMRVIFAEQLYRAFKVSRVATYHK